MTLKFTKCLEESLLHAEILRTQKSSKIFKNSPKQMVKFLPIQQNLKNAKIFANRSKRTPKNLKCFPTRQHLKQKFQQNVMKYLMNLTNLSK